MARNSKHRLSTGDQLVAVLTDGVRTAHTMGDLSGILITVLHRRGDWTNTLPLEAALYCLRAAYNLGSARSQLGELGRAGVVGDLARPLLYAASIMRLSIPAAQRALCEIALANGAQQVWFRRGNRWVEYVKENSQSCTSTTSSSNADTPSASVPPAS